MRKQLKIVLLLLLPFSVCAQYQQLDSLLLQLKNAANDTIRIDLYSQLGTYYDDVNVDSSVYYNEAGITIAKQLQLKLNEAELFMNMSFPLAKMGNYPKTLKVLMQAKEIAEDAANEKHVANLKGETSRTYRLRMLSYTYLGLGFLYARTGNNEKRISTYQEATRLAESIKDTLLLAQIVGDLGDAYYHLNKPDSAFFCLKQSIGYFDALPVDQRKFEGSVFLSLGILYNKTGKQDLAKENFQNAIVISELLNNAAYKGEGYLQLANFYQSIGKPDSSLHYYRKTLDAYKTIGIDNNKVLAYRMISDFYIKQQNKDSSLAYLRMAVLLNDSLGSVEKNRLQEFQNIGFNEQLRLRELEEEKKQTQNKVRIYSLLTGLGLFLLVGIFLYRNNRQKQKANKELATTLVELKSTQSQLIQSEKMASLGELTAGIAHEIQNPLNFVNNFSEVSAELTNEMIDEINLGNTVEVKALADDLVQNLQKINHHGKRADAIVKGMLQHSRSGGGQKELADLNALTEEYVRLCYHGLQAKDNSFNATIKTSFDDSIGKINIIPQDIGRVLLNILTNAFYAVTQKQKAEGQNYKAEVAITTKKVNDRVELRITDNGNGISQANIDKIFQPFFTTKPTGQGTGLGLSLAYDIVKAHGGELDVNTIESEGTIFIISLPISTS
jgi:signal transduction histidine kinase